MDNCDQFMMLKAPDSIYIAMILAGGTDKLHMASP